MTDKNETELSFKEEKDFLNRIKKVKSKEDADLLFLKIEYNILAENYEKLLKSTILISKTGDKAQKKLLKYKEILEQLTKL